MIRLAILMLGPMAALLAGCSGDPYPAMHLKPTQEVGLEMSPSRTVYGRLYGLQDVQTSPLGLPLRLGP